MNKYFCKKLISCFLAFVFVLSVIPFGAVSAAGSDDSAFRLPVHGSEYSSESMRFFEIAGRFYIDLEDAARLTRFAFSEDNEKITLTQGVRTVAIEKASGHMTDCGVVDQGIIAIPKRGGRYLCEAIPMLVYLGANVSIRNDRVLSVNMPNSTIWEALMPEYFDYCFDPESLFGGRFYSSVNLGLDIISGWLDSFLDGFSLYEATHYLRARYEAALKEAMEVRAVEYSKASDVIADDNLKANTYIGSELVSDMVDLSADAVETSAELAELYLDETVIPYIGNAMKNLSEVLSKSDLKTVECTAQEMVDQLKTGIEVTELTATMVEVGSAIVDAVLVSLKMMGYEADAVCALRNSASDELCSAIGYEPPWKQAAEHLSGVLENNEEIIVSNCTSEMADFVLDSAVSDGIDVIISLFVSGAGVFTLARGISRIVASFLIKDSLEAYEADMNAMFLRREQNDMAVMVDTLWSKARDEDRYGSADSLKALKDMFGLYYRTSIALFENYAVSLKEFNGASGAARAEVFAGRDTDSYANTMAEYLQKLTNCSAEPIPRFSSLRDDLLSTGFMAPFVEATPTPVPTAAPTAAPTSAPQNGSSMTVEEIVERLTQHYRTESGDNNYIIFAGEMIENSQYYFFVLRYQGGFSANTYVMSISVNKSTGLVEDEYGRDTWHLW